MKKNLIIYAKNIILLIIIAFCSFLIAEFLRPIAELKIDKSKIDNNFINKRVELVFNTDKNYMNYLRVALKSAIINKNKDSIYNISVFCVDLSDNDIIQIKELEDKQNSVEINVIPLSLDMIKDIAPNAVHTWITRTDFFKFLMPEILKNMDKVLYIDSDTIIQKDLLKLYNTDIQNNYLAAVAEDTLRQGAEAKKIIGNFYYHYEYYKYNAGVMLLNLKKMREDGISKKLIDKKIKEPQNGVTQSVYNEIIPYDKIKSLSPINNLLMQHYIKNCLNFRNIKFIYSPYILNYKSIDELINDSVIIHYNGKQKPWNCEFLPRRDIWLKYAKMVDKNWEVEKMEYKK